VKPETTKDEKYVRLSRDARLLFHELIKFSDDEGRFLAGHRYLLGECYPEDDDIAAEDLARWLRELEGLQMIVLYEHEGRRYGAWRNWRKHQRINRASESILPPPPFPEIVAANALPASSRKVARGSSVSSSDVDHVSLTDDSVSDARHDHDALSERSVKKPPDSVNSAENSLNIAENSLNAHSSPRGRALRSAPDPVVVVDEERQTTEPLQTFSAPDTQSSGLVDESLSPMLADATRIAEHWSAVMGEGLPSAERPAVDDLMLGAALKLLQRGYGVEDVSQVIDFAASRPFWAGKPFRVFCDRFSTVAKEARAAAKPRPAAGSSARARAEQTSAWIRRAEGLE